MAWTKLALQDLHHIWEYVAAENPTAATGIMEMIDKATRSLLSYPNLGHSGRIKGTKELMVAGTPYVIPYRLKRGTIEILAVIHSSRRFSETLR